MSIPSVWPANEVDRSLNGWPKKGGRKQKKEEFKQTEDPRAVHHQLNRRRGGV
jgi:hypothetical protein